MHLTTCPEDHELLALASGDGATPELSSHLDDCSECRQRYRRLLAELSSLREAVGNLQLPPESAAKAEAARPTPASIGKYIVLDVLGRGGQADVYRALHAELGREVVIK